jgi:hypothetical protein
MHTDEIATIDLPEIASRQQLGDALGITPQALSQMAVRGEGPKFLRVGRSIRYRRHDVLDWLETRIVDPAARR